MTERTVDQMSIEELRSRVEEAERILRVARQLAQDELRHPESCERAKDRIASLCNDVNALFPGMIKEVPEDAEAPALDDAPEREPQALEASERDDDEDDEDGAGEESDDEAEGEGDSLEDWDVDYDKLRASLQNPALMGQFPDGGAQFKELAEKLLDSHDRHALYCRITEGFQQLEQITREGADQVRHQLAVALTLEELKSKRLD
jgi:hypothetical protein